jgi:hypothetical protein
MSPATCTWKGYIKVGNIRNTIDSSLKSLDLGMCTQVCAKHEMIFTMSKKREEIKSRD